MTTTTNLLDNAIAFSINITKIGTRRKVKSNKVQLREGEGEQPEEKAIAATYITTTIIMHTITTTTTLILINQN